MKVKFVATKKLPSFSNYWGDWKDGEIKEIADDVASTLIAKFPCFVEVKKQEPAEDKMMRQPEETKSIEIDNEGKPTGKEKLPGKGLFKKKKGWKRKK